MNAVVSDGSGGVVDGLVESVSIRPDDKKNTVTCNR